MPPRQDTVSPNLPKENMLTAEPSRVAALIESILPRYAVFRMEQFDPNTALLKILKPESNRVMDLKLMLDPSWK